MACEWNEKLNALFDGELAGDARVSVEAHVAQCADCAAEMARTQRVARFLKAATIPVMSEIALARLRETIHGRRTLRLAGWLTTAAAAVMLSSSAMLYSMQTPSVRYAPKVALTATGDETNSVLLNAVMPGTELASTSESVDPLALAVLRSDVTRDEGRE